jgi:hypothetical protein
MYELILLVIISLIIGYKFSYGIKSQFVRLIDIFVYGPILIYLGTLVYYTPSITNNKTFGLITIFMGSTTISYNYRNYRVQKEREKLTYKG